MRGMISVCVIEDHPVFRHGLAMFVENATAMRLVGSYPSVEAYDEARTEPPRVIVLDLHLPGLQGGPAVEHLSRPDTRVLVVSGATQRDDVLEAIGAGACGYLGKDTGPEEIVKAIEVVAGGGTYVSATLASFLLTRIDATWAATRSDSRRKSTRCFPCLPVANAMSTSPNICSSASVPCVHISTASATRPGSAAARTSPGSPMNVGSSTRSPLGPVPASRDLADEAHQQAEDALLQALLSLRGMHLLQGIVSMATAWRAYRRPRLAAATLAFSAAESMWVARRCWNRHAVDDPTAVWVDTMVGVGGLLSMRAATTTADCTSWMNWMAPINLETVAAAAVALPRRDAVVVALTVACTYLVSVKSSVIEDRGALATVVVSSLAFLGFSVAGDRFARHLRGSANDIELARRDAVVRGERFALERERVRQHRLISRSALEALGLVADGWSIDADGDVRTRVRREAARLRGALSSTDEDGSEGLAPALREMTEGVAAQGLTVELILAELDAELSGSSIVALVVATREALANVVQHADVSRAVVRLSSDLDHVELTVRDHGRGCDSAELARALVGSGGIATQIIDPLRRVGGTAELQSASGRGMLLILRIAHAAR